jgi:hypothetical protein
MHSLQNRRSATARRTHLGRVGRRLAAVAVLLLPGPASAFQAATSPPAGAAPSAHTMEEGPRLALPAGPRAGEELTVYHVTYGQGDAVWEKFGHNVLWVQDAHTGTTISWNYGIFSFDQPGFVPRLMRGDMLYQMDGRDAYLEMSVYQAQDRSITVQRLNLTPAQRHALREYLEWNWLPENRSYLYDYFRDNCSTRIRDVLDRTLGGAISATLTGVPTNSTLRWHSLRLTGGSLATWTGLVLGLGPPTDQPIDAWEESFIPMQFQQHLRRVQVPDGRGGMVPLVAEERVVYEPVARAPEPDEPPRRTLAFLLGGLLLGGGFAGLGLIARSGRRAVFGLAVALTLWGVITGFFGLLLALLWAVTNHVYSYGNLNLLQVNPLGFVLAVAAPLALLRRTTGRRYATSRLAWPAAVTLAALSAVGLLLHLAAGVAQVNGPIIALALPAHAGVVFALYQALGGQTSSGEDGTAAIRLPAAA